MTWDALERFLALPVEELAMCMLRAAMKSGEPKGYFDFFLLGSDNACNGLRGGVGADET